MSVTKVMRCVRPVVSVGAVFPGQRTAAGHVIVPLVWTISNVNAKAVPLLGGLLNVKVTLPLTVRVKKLPNEQSMSAAATVSAVWRTDPFVGIVPVIVGDTTVAPAANATVPLNVGDASGATPVNVLLANGIVLLLRVCVFVAVSTLDGVMMFERAAIIRSPY